MKKKLILGIALTFLLSSTVLPVWGAITDEEFCDICRNGSMQQAANAIKAGANVNAQSKRGKLRLKSLIS